jgi:hypothetical protein
MGMLKDGFKTLIGFAADATVEIEEIEVTPFGVEGGGAINDATMRNTAYRTQAPKLLKTITNAGCVYAYDPACLTKILALINVNNLITITHPDNSTHKVWGWMNSFVPSAHTEGERPTADSEIIASNRNGSGVETGPVYAAAP